jgi:hypothetical protein
MGLQNIHITYLKKLIDEMICYNGAVTLENTEKVVDKIKMDYILKLAFRFYKHLLASPQYSTYLKQLDEKTYERSADGYHLALKNIMFILKLEHYDETIPCLNCGKEYHLNEFKSIATDLPICTDCFNSINEELDKWEKVYQ